MSSGIFPFMRSSRKKATIDPDNNTNTPIHLYIPLKKVISADMVFESFSATGLYRQNNTALLKPISAIFNTVRIDVHNPDNPKYSELNVDISIALIKNGHITNSILCNNAHLIFLFALAVLDCIFTGILDKGLHQLRMANRSL